MANKEISRGKEKPTLLYTKFTISKFKAIDSIELDLHRNNMLLLLGINESGKTSILEAIEAFDYRNDPWFKSEWFDSFRNKADISFSDNIVISASIMLEDTDNENNILSHVKKEIGDNKKFEIIKGVIKKSKINNFIIERIFSFESGNYKKRYYRIKNHKGDIIDIGDKVIKEIIKYCPYIIYFEDFEDLLPQKIHTNNEDEKEWFDILDGLFFYTNEKYSIKMYKDKYEAKPDDAKTMLNKINQKLNEIFTNKWKALMNDDQIKEIKLQYNGSDKTFEIKVIASDDTEYKVQERSKGAKWYLSFLMKTEFRSKKLRQEYGKPVYLLDEPASNLHSAAQQNMIESFSDLAKNTLLIYTTHSQYLISLGNIQGTYVVKKEDSKIDCIKWGNYIEGKNIQTIYYQPLLDHLKIIPNNYMDIPWKKAVIVEGIDDFHVLEYMRTLLFEKEVKEYAIYPSTSSCKMGGLISLSLGWGAKIILIFDSDKAGKEESEKYREEFSLTDNDIILLPGSNTKIEKLFSHEERRKIYARVFDIDIPEKNLTKHMFQHMFAKIFKEKTKIDDLLSAETKKKFFDLFKELKKRFKEKDK